MNLYFDIDGVLKETALSRLFLFDKYDENAARDALEYLKEIEKQIDFGGKTV